MISKMLRSTGIIGMMRSFIQLSLLINFFLINNMVMGFHQDHNLMSIMNRKSRPFEMEETLNKWLMNTAEALDDSFSSMDMFHKNDIKKILDNLFKEIDESRKRLWDKLKGKIPQSETDPFKKKEILHWSSPQDHHHTSSHHHKKKSSKKNNKNKINRRTIITSSSPLFKSHEMFEWTSPVSFGSADDQKYLQKITVHMSKDSHSPSTHLKAVLYKVNKKTGELEELTHTTEEGKIVKERMDKLLKKQHLIDRSTLSSAHQNNILRANLEKNHKVPKAFHNRLTGPLPYPMPIPDDDTNTPIKPPPLFPPRTNFPFDGNKDKDNSLKNPPPIQYHDDHENSDSDDKKSKSKFEKYIKYWTSWEAWKTLGNRAKQVLSDPSFWYDFTTSMAIAIVLFFILFVMIKIFSLFFFSKSFYDGYDLLEDDDELFDDHVYNFVKRNGSCEKKNETHKDTSLLKDIA